MRVPSGSWWPVRLVQWGRRRTRWKISFPGHIASEDASFLEVDNWPSSFLTKLCCPWVWDDVTVNFSRLRTDWATFSDTGWEVIFRPFSRYSIRDYLMRRVGTAVCVVLETSWPTEGLCNSLAGHLLHLLVACAAGRQQMCSCLRWLEPYVDVKKHMTVGAEAFKKVCARFEGERGGKHTQYIYVKLRGMRGGRIIFCKETETSVRIDRKCLRKEEENVFAKRKKTYLERGRKRFC